MKRTAVLVAVTWGVLIEAVAIAPALLSPWGHAGPTSTLGWVGIALNLPGIGVAALLSKAGIGNESLAVFIAAVVVVQVAVISGIVFVVRRWRNRARG